jgi:hypothetical protein
VRRSAFALALAVACIAIPAAAAPQLLRNAVAPSGASVIRWWSNDGGSSWSIFGRC